jgi:hypothetical protein
MKVRTWQRTVQLFWTVVGTAGMALLLWRGSWGWAVLLAVVLLCAQAFWLGVQFWLAAASVRRCAAAGDMAVAPPSRAAWWRAWWVEVWMCTRSYGWHQPWSHVPADGFEPGAGARSGSRTAPSRGILLVHGYLCSGGFWQPWLKQLRALGRPHFVVSLEPGMADIDSYAAQIEAAYRRLHAATGGPPLIVAHSMGSLVVRAWLRWRLTARSDHALEGGAPLDIISLGSPHFGTWVARHGRGRAAAQMCESSHWLTELAQFEADHDLHALANWVCVYSDCDNMVYPPRNACLPGAHEVFLPGLAHMELAFDPRVVELTLWLADELPGSTATGLTLPAALDAALTRPAAL